MWPFGKRTEQRSAQSYSDEVTALILARAAGETTDANLLAVVEACSGMWERAIASATVSPESGALRGVTPGVMAMMGRGLAYRGEFVASIEIDGGMVKLLPAASWDIHGGGPDPMSWYYRVDMSGPSRTRTVPRLPESIVHVRLADPRSPWRGRSPLNRSRATATLAARIETAMQREARIPPTRIAPTPLVGEDLKLYTDRLREGGIMGTGAGQPISGDQQASSRWTPAVMKPEPDQVFEALRTRAGHDIASAYGVPPALFEPRGDGAGQREAWRRFWAGTIAPIGRCVQDELRAKLDPMAVVSFDALAASDEDGRSRAVSRRAVAFKTFMDAGIERADALRLAGLDDSSRVR